MATGDLVRRVGGSDLRRQQGVIVTLYTEPPPGSVVVCLDQLGPESAKSFPGQQVVSLHDDGRRTRATQEIDDGRRGTDSIFGAFTPADGAALTMPDDRRTSTNWIDVLSRGEARLPTEVEWVYAILDNLSVHRATDVLLFALAHPRWEFVFQPTYAAYLNLIEPWWKVLRSLALKGRRFETWEEGCRAVEDATSYWNAHRHPFMWGCRKRRTMRRHAGIAAVPKAAQDLPDGSLSMMLHKCMV
ncbi:MAG: transposase [Chloroflexota bacterium]|nr:transposase [Chloroflexota bacterium]